MVDLGQIAIKCCIPVVPREGFGLSLHLVSVQMANLLSKCYLFLYLFPPSKLSAELQDWLDRAFSVVLGCGS